MLVFLWQEIFQSTGRAETSTPEEQCSGWWRGQGEQLLLNFSEVLHLSCMIWNVWNILPVLIWRDQWAYLRLNFEACTRLCWEICLLYLCLEKLLFRLLNKSIFFGRAEKKKKLMSNFKCGHSLILYILLELSFATTRITESLFYPGQQSPRPGQQNHLLGQQNPLPKQQNFLPQQQNDLPWAINLFPGQ